MITTAPKIEFYRSQLAGNPCARCTGCGSTYVYWDDIDELAHACPTICPQCEGEGESVPVWDEDIHTRTRNVCPSCSGTGSVRQIVEP